VTVLRKSAGAAPIARDARPHATPGALSVQPQGTAGRPRQTKVVSERLGHANVSIALDTYSHAIPAMEE
jgi:integrase